MSDGTKFKKQTQVQRTLFKKKEWVTVPDAAQYLANEVGQDFSEADVLKLGLNGHLKLSVNFVNNVKVKCGKPIIVKKDIAWKELSSEMMAHYIDQFFAKPDSEFMDIGGQRYLKLDDNVKSINGLWDLPMIGQERQEIEQLYHKMTGGPKVTLVCTDGPFVEEPGGWICQLQYCMEATEFKTGAGKTRKIHECYYPALDLPRNYILVVRTQALLDYRDSLYSRARSQGGVLMPALIDDDLKDLLKSMGCSEDSQGDLTVGLAERAYMNDKNPMHVWRTIERIENGDLGGPYPRWIRAYLVQSARNLRRCAHTPRGMNGIAAAFDLTGSQLHEPDCFKQFDAYEIMRAKVIQGATIENAALEVEREIDQGGLAPGQRGYLGSSKLEKIYRKLYKTEDDTAG